MAITAGTAACEGDGQGTNYPVVYKVATWVRVLMLSLAAAATVAGFLLFLPVYAGESKGASFSMFFASVGMAFSFYAVWGSFSTKLMLFPDRLQWHKPLGTRILPVSEIIGRVTLPKGNTPMIVPRTGLAFSLDRTIYGLDENFDRWWLKLPDARQVQSDEDRARARNDPSLGATPEQRLATYAGRQKRFGALSLVMISGSALTFFAGIILMSGRHLFPASIAGAALPWCGVAIGLPYREFMGKDGGRNGFGLLLLPMMMSGMLLTIMALDRSGLVDPFRVFRWGVLAGLPLWLAVAAVVYPGAVPVSQKLPGWLLFACLSGAYGFGALALGNRLLDDLPPQIFQAQVIGKHQVQGKGGPSHYLELAAWGPEPQGNELFVDGAEYSMTESGDRVCMGLYRGKFGFSWRRRVTCPAGT